MTTNNSNHDIANLSYEAARDELIKIVRQLEQGGATLQQSIELWERGEALANRCEQWLSGARAQLDKVRNQAVNATEA